MKWGLWIFRALFYPAAALVAALLLLDHDGEKPRAATPVTLSGWTAQDKVVNASLRDGRVFRFGAKLDSACGNIDKHWTTSWWPVAGSDKFTYGGDFVRVRTVRDVTINWNVTEDLRFAGRMEHGLLTGSLQAIVTVHSPFQAQCRSGVVRFFAK